MDSLYKICEHFDHMHQILRFIAVIGVISKKGAESKDILFDEIDIKREHCIAYDTQDIFKERLNTSELCILEVLVPKTVNANCSSNKIEELFFSFDLKTPRSM